MVSINYSWTLNQVNYVRSQHHLGVNRFKRLPFGLSIAPEIFQKINVKYFENVPNVIFYFDDLLIYAESIDEHDKILKEVVERAIELNIKFNKS